MKIGIIGAGFIGKAITELAVKSGHSVMLSNSRDPNSMFSTLRALHCEGGTAQQAAEYGDIVLVAVPFYAVVNLPAEALKGKVVMDANNYYPERDGHYPQLDREETTTSEMFANWLPGTRVVKVFNAIYANELLTDGRLEGAKDRRALPVASDDQEAKQQVIELLSQFGFDALDTGGLAESWRFERDMPCYCLPLNKQQLGEKLAEAKRNPHRA